MANQYPEQSRQNRLIAIGNGAKHYISATPCPQCGSLLKYVSNQSCKECTAKKGLERLNNSALMEQYRTKAKANAKTYRYRAKKKNGTPEDADHKQIQSIYEACEKITRETGILHHVDHIHPISKGGQHHQDNLQILTAEENIKKSNNIL